MSKNVEKKLRRLGIEEAEKEQMSRTFDRIQFGRNDAISEQETEEDAEDLAETESKIDPKIVSEETDENETDIEELEKPWNKNLDATNPISPVKKLEKNIKHQVLNNGFKEMNDFGTLNLQDSYDESSFTGAIHKTREFRSGGGSRRFMKVRQFDKMGDEV